MHMNTLVLFGCEQSQKPETRMPFNNIGVDDIVFSFIDLSFHRYCHTVYVSPPQHISA